MIIMMVIHYDYDYDDYDDYDDDQIGDHSKRGDRARHGYYQLML